MKGQDYAAIKFVTTKDGCVMRYVTCVDAMKGKSEQVMAEIPVELNSLPAPYTQKYAVDDIPQPRLATQDFYLRVKVESSGMANAITCSAQFFYSTDGKKFQKLGTPFTVKEGKWIGAKLGFYNSRPETKNDGAFLDIDFIHFEK